MDAGVRDGLEHNKKSSEPGTMVKLQTRKAVGPKRVCHKAGGKRKQCEETVCGKLLRAHNYKSSKCYESINRIYQSPVRNMRENSMVDTLVVEFFDLAAEVSRLAPFAVCNIAWS